MSGRSSNEALLTRVDRRRFVALAGTGVGAAALAASCRGRDDARGERGGEDSLEEADVPEARAEGRVALARRGSPARNAAALLDAWGGVESLFGPDDVVVFKVNAQWYAQGMTNTDVLEGLALAILERPGGFRGDLVVADNHHFRTELGRGWTTDQPNGARPLYGVVEALRARGHERVHAVQWRDAGPNPDPWQGDDGGHGLAKESPLGVGYRWDLDECHVTPEGNRCAMTWPVFLLPSTGEHVDLREGVSLEGASSGRTLRVVNISSLNHHSRYAGVTASIKNLMGVVDMTCGFQGPTPEGYLNTHYIGMRDAHRVWRWAKRSGGLSRRVVHKLLPEEKAIDFHHTGGALGHLMRTVRMPDLHVVTAEWIGFGSRTHPELAARPGVSLAALDPVSLDAVAGREVLMPATRAAEERGLPFLAYNDPDREEGPFRLFLEEARKKVGGRLDPGDIDLIALEA